ncbi:ABC transporter substrate-binding protein [Aquipuribacter sp. SD81]|uniref:ABC transporter substrate-binding protein n=1 Tax=Aquipuribacter sp. SD81 TaxID=3127703 RepID=UPI0030187BEB
MNARTTRRLAAVASLPLAALLVAACGGDGTTSTPADGATTSGGAASEAAAPDAADTSAAPSDPASAPTGDAAGDFPVTVASGQLPDTTDLVVEERPTSIVSISPTATEMLFAVGAGEQVVAVDAFSYYPEEAPVTDLSGFEPNLEAILGYDPDLVVASGDPGDLVSGLDAAGVPTLLLPSALDLEESYDQVRRVGAATGHADAAEDVVAETQANIDAAVADAGDAGEGLTYYHELDPSFFTASGDTFIGEVYGLFGLENIADETGEAYPQLSQEFVVEADPDLVFVTSGDFSASPEEIADRSGWGEVTAVENGDVVVVDADTASRWGPRTDEFARSVADALVDAVPAGR